MKLKEMQHFELKLESLLYCTTFRGAGGAQRGIVYGKNTVFRF